jgi:predicted alpha/beta-hydrolase family hydrolase
LQIEKHLEPAQADGSADGREDMSAASARWEIAVGDAGTTSAAWDPPAESSGIVFVCAHGAGGHMDDRAILSLRDVFRDRGIGFVRFNFLYRARGSARPDPMPALLACWTAVVARVRQELDPRVLILGGRSMGGRAASMLVAEGAGCSGLLLLAYPLHPPGQPQKLRDAHLPAITVPVLCINGTRDTFCDQALMKQVLTRLGANWRMHWIPDGDHSFRVPKRSGRTDKEVLAAVGDVCRGWIGELR